jgi:glutamate racemase
LCHPGGGRDPEFLRNKLDSRLRGNDTTGVMIGVFDSGFGGLTVLKSLLEKLPEHNYIYLGDSARVPYGNKSPEVIYKYAEEAVDFLFGQGCKIIIFACNTASAQALRKIQQEYLPVKHPGKNVLGVIRPLAEAAAAKNFKKIGVIGTTATIKSGSYEIEIKKINPEMEIFSIAAPLLVPLIEESWAKSREARMILRRYLRPLKLKKIQALILGCTHYPLMLDEIKSVMGKNCLVFPAGEIITESFKNYLSRHSEYEISSSKNQTVKFFTTDDPKKFKEIGEKFLKRKIEDVKKIEL